MKTAKQDATRLKDKEILLGVTGSIAAYKACDLARMFLKAGASVTPVMTENAAQFVTPLTFSTLCRRATIVDMFHRPDTYDVEHIELARRADILVIAPASANIIGKLAHGIADDFLTTLFLSVRAPVLIAPAMNWAMYTHPVVQDNIRALESRGCQFVHPEEGELACGEVGAGRLAELEMIVSAAEQLLEGSGELAGKKGLVTAGPTREAIDPVRFISNRSSGKMGFELAAAAARRGAEVTVVTGPTHLQPPPCVTVVPVTTAQEMYDACIKVASRMEFVIGAAAVSDYAPVRVSDRKIKKTRDSISVELKPTPDIIAAIGAKKKKGQIVVGFAAETENVVQNAKKKLRAKNLDLIVANDLTVPGSGFAVDTNAAVLLDRTGKAVKLPLMTKRELAERVIDRVVSLLKK
jgi:phosphopantothenoylcysteine decarboxylase/phosphopantothenate--cysteine ligase